jgi:hypothetical protein
MTAAIHRKSKILVGYASTDIEDFFSRFVVTAGYEVKLIPYKEIGSLLDSAHWADAIFLQWDGRGQIGHDLIQRFFTGVGAHKVSCSIYAVTSNHFKIEILNPKASRAIGISNWFEIPTNKDELLKELSLLIPDQYDEFSTELESCGLPLLRQLPLESLAGKHLIGLIKSAWEDRFHRATNVTKVKDEILRSHVTFFHDDEARTNELKTFLTDIKFKYHDEFSDLIACTRWIRGHGTDCLVVWYDAKSTNSVLLLRMYLQNRTFRRIPFVVLHASDSDVALFKKNFPDIFIDKFILYDRNKEKFRTALVESFEIVSKDHGSRHILDTLRHTAQDFPPDKKHLMTQQEVEAAITELNKDEGKKYWAETEHLLAISRFHDMTRYPIAEQVYQKSWAGFDASFNLMTARAGLGKQELIPAIQQFLERFSLLDDLNFDRLVRTSNVLARLGSAEALKKVLVMWWQSKDRFPVGHEFYFTASRWAGLSGHTSLERALLALALKAEPLRNDYVEAYISHLIHCSHLMHAQQLCEYLIKSEYFPPKRALMILYNLHHKSNNKSAALSTLDEILTRWPGDRQSLALKQKLSGSA